MMSQENRKGLDETVLKEQSAQEKQEAEHATWENANTTWSGTGDTWEDIKPKALVFFCEGYESPFSKLNSCLIVSFMICSAFSLSEVSASKSQDTSNSGSLWSPSLNFM